VACQGKAAFVERLHGVRYYSPDWKLLDAEVLFCSNRRFEASLIRTQQHTAAAPAATLYNVLPTLSQHQ
jgi:hypothetical protein